METISPRRLKKRAAVETWKSNNYEYYLEQKRRLARRPEYLKHRRDMYREKIERLKLVGILPKKRGRKPQVCSTDENIFSPLINGNQEQCENSD